MAGDSTSSLQVPANTALPPEALARVQGFEQALERGERPPIEAYLQDYPATDEDDRRALLLALVKAELRRRDTPAAAADVENYVRRFPFAETALRDMLGSHREREDEPPPAHPAPAGTDPPLPGAATADMPTPTHIPPFLPAVGLGGSALPTLDDPVQTRPTAGPSGATPSLPFPALTPESPRRSFPRLPPGYEILGELGAGGMGIVYKAREQELNRVVALKMIGGRGRPSPKDLERIRTEAKAIARIKHPHILQIYKIGEHEGLPFLELEYCPGGSLADALRGKTLAPQEAAEIVEKLARGIEAAHKRHVVHRDLKPSNVLLDADGQPKISDFGLAKKLDEVGQTVAGEIMGTPCYMAPEQAAGRAWEIGAVTDVYALAATLYDLLTGRPPFKGSSTLETLEQVRKLEPVPPSRLEPKVPRDLETICLKGLNKDRSRRYASAQELADDLRRFLNHEPIKARRVSRRERLFKWVRREPAQAALVGAVLLAVLAVVAGAVLFGLYQSQNAAELSRQIKRRQMIDGLWGEGTRAERDGQAALDRADEVETDRQLAAAREKWEAARSALALESEPGDAELLRQVEQALERVGRYQERRQQRQQLVRKSQEFFARREEILTREIDPPGGDRAAIAGWIRGRARDALSRFNLGIDTPLPEAARLGEQWREAASPEAARRLEAGCFEVLLSWAEAEATALPGVGKPGHEAQLRQALRLLNVARAVRPNPDLRSFHLRKAKYLEAAGDRATAGEERAAAARLPAATALDHFLSALDLYQQGKIREAAAACDQALKQEPDYFPAQYLQAVCHVRSRRWLEAHDTLTKYLVRWPDSFGGHALRGTALGSLGLFDSAEADFAWALALANDPPSKSAVLTNRGAMRFRRGRLAEAEADWKEVLRLQPEAYPAYANLTLIHLKREQWAAAAAAGKAMERHPTPADLVGLYRARARARVGLGDRAGARADFQEAIARRPPGERSEDLASDYVELGRLRHQAGDYHAALDAYQAALRAFPDYALAHRQRAETLLKLGRDAEAGEALDLYLKKGGTPTAAVHKARGLIHTKQHELRQALVAFSKALELKGDDVEALRHRGWTSMRLNLARPALDDFEEALKQTPGHAETQCGRAHALVLLGRVPEGLAVAEELRRPGRHDLDERLLFGVACLYARAAGQVAARPDRRSAANQQLVTGYQQQAADLIALALRRVPEKERRTFWRKNVHHEAALDAIRNHPAFVELDRWYGR